MFILKNLHVENFMSIDCADFSFEDRQITAITGTNGSGKSSLLYAIAYTICNYREGDANKDYVKKGTECARIHLEVSFDGEPLIYDVELGNGKGKNNFNNKKVSYKDKLYVNSDYTQFLQTYKLEELQQLMFMFQGTSDIINARPTERANLLKKLFKFDFPEIVDSLKEEQESIKIKSAEHTTLIDDLKNRKYNKLPLLRENAPVAIEGWETRVNDIEGILKQIGDIDENEISSCDSDITTTQRLHVNLESTIDNDKLSLEKLKSQLMNLQKKIEDTDFVAIQESIYETQKKIADHEIKYNEQRDKDTELNEELKVLQYKEKELNKQLEISKTGICHACGQPIESSHVDKLKEELSKVKEEIESKKAEIKNLAFDKTDSVGKNLRNVLTYNEEISKRYNSDLKAKDALTTRISDLTSLIEERLNTLNEYHKKLTLLQEKKTNLNSIVTLLKEKTELIKERDDLREKLQTARDNKIKNIERRSTNLKIEQEEKENNERLAKLNEELNTVSIALSRNKQELDIFESKFPNFITIQACKQLEAIINDIVQRIFPYCVVSLKPSRGGVSFFYTAESSDDEEIPVAMASGAQKKILSLAYFIALARLNGISCIFLDEIDASLTAENASVVYDFIASVDYFPQVFFISHRKEAHEAVKAKNESLVTYSVNNGIYTLM